MPKPPACPWCETAEHVEPAPTGRGYMCHRCDRYFLPGRTRASSGARTTRARSSRQESHNARKVGGYLTVNSGALDDKGDVKVRGLLREEDKTTLKASYVLKLADLRKVAAAARGDEIPIMRIAFEDRLDQQFVVVSSDTFNMLLEHYKETR